MSYQVSYLPNSKGGNLEITNEIVLRGLPVYDTLMGLSSNFTGLATNITGTDLTLSGNANVTGFIVCNRVSVGSLTPTNSSHLTSKQYVDSLIPLAGVGLSKSGVTFNINSSQPTITSVGTLTGLTLSGALTGTTGTFSGTVTVATPTAGGNATTKSYVDTALALKADTSSTVYLAGTGLTKTSLTFSVNSAQPTITSLGTLSSLTLSGALTGTSASFSSPITVGTPVGTNDAVTKAYCDSFIPTASNGLTKTGNAFSVNTSQIMQSIVAPGASNFISLKPNSTLSSEFLLTSTSVILRKNDGSNVIYFDLTNGSIIVDFPITTNSTIGGVTASEFNQVANINTTTISAASWANVGNMNQNVSTTSSPTFAMVAITNTTDSTSNTTGSLVTAGGLGIGKSLYLGGPVYPTVTAGGMVLNADGFGNFKFGSSTNTASSWGIVSNDGNPLLTLWNNIAGTPGFKIYATTDSTSSTSGSTQVLGGMGIAKSLYVGGSLNCTGAVTTGGNLIINSTMQSVININGSNTFGSYIGISNSSSNGNWQLYCGGSAAGNPFSGGNFTIYNDAASTPSLTISKTTNAVSLAGALSATTGTFTGAVTSGKIYAYGGLNQIVVGNSATPGAESSIAFLANTNGTFGTGVQTGWAVGNGVGNMGQGNFAIYGTGVPGNAFSIQYVDNSITHHSLTDSTSSTTGGTKILGGLGVVKNVYVGGTLNVTGAVTVPTPTLSSQAATKGYVDSAITTANAGISTGTFTSGTFTITGLVFMNLTKSVRWSKIGNVVLVSAEFSWTSTIGTITEADGNCAIQTPFNSPIVRSMNCVIQKDSFATTKMSYMDEASPALRTRVNGADMPGYASGATLLFSWTFFT